MRIIIFLLSLTFLISCNSVDAPKCDNEEAIELVISILSDHNDSLVDQNGNQIELTKKTKMKNIVSKSVDEKLNSCECEGIVEVGKKEAKIRYSVKETESGIYVNVNKVSSFQPKL